MALLAGAQAAVAAEPPLNDDFAKATPIYRASGSVTGSIVGATREPGEPDHGGGSTSVWYRWTAPATGSAQFDTTGSLVFTALAVYTGSSLPGLQQVVDAGFGDPSLAKFAAVAGTEYRIAVDSRPFGATGQITLNWFSAAAPANDNYANAQPISGSTGSVPGTNVGATQEPGEPPHAHSVNGSSVWYRWTAPATGTAFFNSSGSAITTVLAVYTGPTVSELTLVADSSGGFGGSASDTLSFAAVASTEYHIAIEGRFGITQQGPVVLNWTSPAVVTTTGRYTPLTPARILDTRIGIGGFADPVGPGATIDVQVTGRGGVPATGVSAVAMNVTVTQPTGAGYLTLFPTASPQPLAANLNFTPAETVPNLVVVKLGAGGKASLFNSAGSSHVIFDLAGWYSDIPAGNDGRYSALVPARILDTRTGTGGSSLRLGPGASMDLAVSGAGGVPGAGAEAAVLNVAVTNATATSFLTVYPTGVARPLAANLNFNGTDTVSNRVMATLGAGGKVTIYNNAGDTDVIIDVNGWYSDATVAGTTGAYTPVVPGRILDTRDGTGGIVGPVAGGTSVDVQVTGRGGVPATGVSAVVLNATVTQPAGPGFLTIAPTGTARPFVSDLNYASDETRPNLVVVRVGTGGKVNLFTQTGTQVVFDVAGWFS